MVLKRVIYEYNLMKDEITKNEYFAKILSGSYKIFNKNIQ